MKNILIGIGAVVVIGGILLLIKYWDNIFPPTEVITPTGTTATTAGGRYATTKDESKKIICEYINDRGETIKMEGYGEAFAEECRRKTRNDLVYQNNYAYYPYRWSYYTQPSYYYWYPWSNSYSGNVAYTTTGF